MWEHPPRFFTAPQFEYTAGDVVADFVAGLSYPDEPVIPDADQRMLLRAIFAGPQGATFRTRHLKWAASSSVIIAPRQNLKTSTMQMGLLGALFLLDAKKIIWTAHVFNPAVAETLRWLTDVIRSNPALDRRVDRILTASGREAIELRDSRGRVRSRVEFLARSTGGGRSLSADLIVLDEAYALSTGQVGALLPTRSARPNSMVWYGSSAGRIESTQLRMLRDRGRRGTVPRQVYAEWCSESAVDPANRGCASPKCSHEYGVEDGCVLDDHDQWAQANSALGRRIDVQTVEDERAGMDALEFGREREGWWDEPTAGQVISMSKWLPLAVDPDDLPQIHGGVALMVDVTLDRSASGIGLCGMNDAQVALPQVELPLVAPGTDWVTDKVNDLIAAWPVAVVGCRAQGPAASLLPDLAGVCESAGVEFVKIGSGEWSGMCGQFYDAVMAGSLAHLGDSRIEAAMKAAKQHRTVDSWQWERTNVDVDAMPLVCATGAYALHARFADIAAEYDLSLSVR